MPTVSDPNARYPYVLESDLDKPIDEMPVFFFRIWTMRQFRAKAKTITSLTKGTDNDEVFDAAISVITDALVDWHNVRLPGSESLLPFDPENKRAIEDIVGVNELLELAYAVRNQEPDPETKKKLSWPSSSAQDSADKQPAGDQQTASDQSTQ